MSARTRQFIPRLEALDDRSLPSVTITTMGTIGATLQITGDAGANNIVITDDGTGAGITVQAEGMTTPWTIPADVTSISAIVVNTLGGNDTVVYDLTDNLTATRLMSVDLGKGADSFTVNMNNVSVSGSSTTLGITVNGGGGRDTLTLNAHGASAVDGAHISVALNGKAGKDTITFNYDPGFLDNPNITLTKDQKH
jgi:hypothetical protein